MSLRYRKRLLEHLKHDDYTARSVGQLRDDLGVGEADWTEFDEAIEDLKTEKLVEVAPNGAIGLPSLTSRGGFVIGKFRKAMKGFGFVEPQEAVREGSVFIPPEATSDALTGDIVKVEVARKGGIRKTFSVRLIAAAAGLEQPVAEKDPGADSADPDAAPAGAVIRPLGITVTPLTSQIASELGAPAGLRGLVIQSVDQEGPAAEVPLFGVESGNPDVILSVEGTPVRSEAELRSALKSAGSGGIVTLVLYNKAGANQGGGRRVERVRLTP